MKEKAKAYAKRHGYTVRAVPHSLSNPNASVKVIAPDGSVASLVDWGQALEWMLNRVNGKGRRK